MLSVCFYYNENLNWAAQNPWLAAHGLDIAALNKQELMDVISYGWKVKGISTHCVCGETNSADHSLMCKLADNTSVGHSLWERSVAMFTQNPHFSQSMKMIDRNGNTVHNAGWIFLQENCGITVRKRSLT